ncbi:unnamed protein product [Arabidopsis halleri]
MVSTQLSLVLFFCFVSSPACLDFFFFWFISRFR